MAKERLRYITKVVDTGTVKGSGAEARYRKNTRRFSKRIAVLAERWGDPVAIVPLRFAMAGGDAVVRSVLVVFRDDRKRRNGKRRRGKKG